MPEYRIWRGMRNRCYNKNCSEYKYYGEQGITVCDEWLNSFDKFFSDMGPRPSKDYSIDRKEGSLGYSKDNCRWSTDKEQIRNRRNTIKVSVDGCERPLSEWAEILNVEYKWLLNKSRAAKTEVIIRGLLEKVAS